MKNLKNDLIKNRNEGVLLKRVWETIPLNWAFPYVVIWRHLFLDIKIYKYRANF